MYGIPPEKFIKDLQKRNGFIEIYDQVMNEKVLELLQKNAQIEDVPRWHSDGRRGAQVTDATMITLLICAMQMGRPRLQVALFIYGHCSIHRRTPYCCPAELLLQLADSSFR